MRRLYLSLAKEHFSEVTQMLFLSGARQVGKTTVARQTGEISEDIVYLNWDITKDRAIITEGQHAVSALFGPPKIRKQKPMMIFDEIHKFSDWKNYLKGFYDLYKDEYHILVTGSARLDVYQAGGDSMMGRYFMCRVHPFSVRELEDTEAREKEILPPINSDNFDRLYEFGGFPDPYLRASRKFSTKWHNARSRQLLYEDIKDLSNIHETKQIEVLMELLRHQTGGLLNRSSLAKKIQVSVPTISNWLSVLERLFHCFMIKPWSNNVSRSLIKEPKLYLYDWTRVESEGARFENFVASHLLKAVDFWNDSGFGSYGLYYLRNKDGHEVDFVVVRDNQPWFLVEAKVSDNGSLSKSLRLFQDQIKAPHAFQVIRNMPYVDVDCFKHKSPILVPARTLLSQLV